MEQMSREILLQLVGQQKEMIALLEEQIRLLKESMARADDQANAMRQEIDFLRKQVEEKQAIIDSLTHKKNSSNSSTPPVTIFLPHVRGSQPQARAFHCPSCTI